MALISNERAGVGLGIIGLVLIPFSWHEAAVGGEWIHSKLWIAGPMAAILGFAMATFPGSGPMGDDNTPSLTKRERRWWWLSGTIGLAAGVGYSVLLEHRYP
ncbi:MAG: hypothetical protein ABI591_30605 [Kofleriaceae bacterium]